MKIITIFVADFLTINMRFLLHLSIDKQAFGNVLPFSYQYELSAFIYHTIAKGDTQYADWLHENGFTLESGRVFRLFCFSHLKVDKIRKTKDNRLCLLSETAQLQIVFLPEQSTEEFVKGIFSDRLFTLGDKQSKVQFSVQSVEILPENIKGNEIIGKTLSPIVLSRKTDKNELIYLSPDIDSAGDMILRNLLGKYEAFHGYPFVGDTTLEWEVLSEPKAKLILFKAGTPNQSKVKGYECTFRLKADKELLKIALNGGLGEKNSMGFGCVAGEIEKDATSS